MYSIYIAYFQNYAFPRLPISKIAHFQDGSMRFTHYYPGRPYDHFIDHSQLPGKRAMELPVRRILTIDLSFTVYSQVPITPGWVAGQRCKSQNSNPRHDPWISAPPRCSLNDRNRQKDVLLGNAEGTVREHGAWDMGRGHQKMAREENTD